MVRTRMIGGALAGLAGAACLSVALQAQAPELASLVAVACGCGTEKLEERPVADATVDAPPATQTTVFAVSFFRLGMTKWDGEPTTEAWKQYGFDLDGQCTSSADSETSKGTCKRVEMSETDVLTDGDNCIDNNFGSKLIAMIRAIDPATETKIGEGIQKGALTHDDFLHLRQDLVDEKAFLTDHIVDGLDVGGHRLSVLRRPVERGPAGHYV